MENHWLIRIQAYSGVAKPGIIVGNLLTAAAGFFFASGGEISLHRLLFMLAGLALVIGSACVFNNLRDQRADAKMERTRQRALVAGRMTNQEAFRWGLLLGLLGLAILFLGISWLAALVALTGFFVYVALYSPLKYRSHHATLVGSIAGSIPALVGYSARSGEIDAAALLLFLIIALWQLPHFFAIAIRRLEEYRAASIPVLPIVRGIPQARRQIVLYVVLFCMATPCLTWLGYTSVSFLVGTSFINLLWLALCLWPMESRRWARHVFFSSLLVILLLCTLLICDSQIFLAFSNAF